uniref:Uncharacterized protein n=1 Tax=Arundo donax TaxID=35708 RepID=A0A0A8YTJ3_ARUDO
MLPNLVIANVVNEATANISKNASSSTTEMPTHITVFMRTHVSTDTSSYQILSLRLFSIESIIVLYQKMLY